VGEFVKSYFDHEAVVVKEIKRRKASREGKGTEGYSGESCGDGIWAGVFVLLL